MRRPTVCLVPGGALDEGGQWHPVKGHYLFPVRALSRRFRGHFVAGLRRRAEAGTLDQVPRRADVDAMRDALMARDCVVYAKPYLGRTDAVLSYLARYTHRIAISDRRVLAMDGERAALRCRDRGRGAAPRTVWLDGVEVVRRYLLHVLPKGFMRIRHYGLLANRGRREHLVRARVAIARFTSPAGVRPPRPVPGGPALALCPRCHRLPLRTLCRPPWPQSDTG